jgi:hypothetical protein
MKRDSNIQKELSEISSIIANVPFVNVYTCSSDYFDHFSKEVSLITNGTNDQKFELKTLKETITYQTPQAYFDNFSNNVIQAINNDVKVNRLNIYNLNLVKFAFAACFISLLGFFIYKFPSIKQNDNLDLKTASLIKEADLIIKKGSFEDEMNKIEEMDLVKYLQDGGQDVDAALVASLDDETQLNDKEIYLYDGETMTNYLNELKIQNSNYKHN